MGARNVPETTPKQAAKALEVSTRTIFNYIRKGLLKSRKEGQKVFIAIESIDELRKKLAMERGEMPPALPENPPPGGETTVQGSFSFHFDPATDLIVKRNEYEALLVRLGHLESEVKFLTHEPEGGKKAEKPLELSWWIVAVVIACIPIVLYLAWSWSR